VITTPSRYNTNGRKEEIRVSSENGYELSYCGSIFGEMRNFDCNPHCFLAGYIPPLPLFHGCVSGNSADIT
jgi:hypothetical protein